MQANTTPGVASFQDEMHSGSLGGCIKVHQGRWRHQRTGAKLLPSAVVILHEPIPTGALAHS